MTQTGQDLVGAGTPTAERGTPARPRPLWRAVALPAEHGGWSLTVEPVVLGLLVVPSPAGLVLGVAALVAFLARTPLKVLLVDRRRGRTLPRTRLAVRAAAAEIALLAGLLAVATATGERLFWIPFVLAAPLVGLELWFDMRSHSRRLAPELAGAIGMGSVASAIVLAGGGAATAAAGAWLVIAARVGASLPFVRYQLSRTRQRPERRSLQDLAQVGAVAAGSAGVAAGLLPALALVPLAGLAVVQTVLARMPVPKAVVVGVQQLFLGLAVVVAAGLAIGSK